MLDAGTRVYLACGATDMRRGFNSLSAHGRLPSGVPSSTVGRVRRFRGHQAALASRRIVGPDDFDLRLRYRQKWC
jgi:hypothetical protein